MQTNEKLVETLNDLIEINNDRIIGYQKAIDEAEAADVDLKAIFGNMKNTSSRFVTELSNEVTKLGGERATGTTNLGKIYRVWMDLKKTFATNDRKAILESCDFGEEAAQKAYDEALAADDIANETRELISGQQTALKADHLLIKKYKDAAIAQHA